MNFAPQKTLFGFLVMAYERMADGDKFSNESLGRTCFNANSHLKIEAKEFFL